MNALLNMDEKGDDALGEDGTPEAANENQDTSGHDVQTDYAEKPLFMRFMATLKDILPQ